MSEYWVSKKKYYCQYCEIYIADDAPSRAQHENGLRHKGNKDRFIRSLYKSGIKKKQESEEEKREMKRVEEAAQTAYARDVGAGHATPGASSSSIPVAPAPKPKPPPPPPPKPSNPYANYTTAASLGFTDPDVERLIAEAEMRKNEGRAGDWISVVPPPPPLPQNGEPDAAGGVKLEPGVSGGEVRKREEEPVDEDDTRRYKMRKKTVALGLGEIYDPGVIRIKPRVDPDVKLETTDSNFIQTRGPTLGGDNPQGDAKLQAADPAPKATEKPTWTRREWKWAGEGQEAEDNSTLPQSNGAAGDDKSDSHSSQSADAGFGTIKTEDDGPKAEPTVEAKERPTNPELPTGASSGGSLFRKRKLPAGSTSTRGRGRRDG